MSPIVTPALRGEIEQALKVGGRGQIKIAMTAKHLAHELGTPVKPVKDALEMMAREGVITSRTLRNGEVLYKAKDKHHDRWAAFRGTALTLQTQEIR